jgi:Zn-dependent protease
VNGAVLGAAEFEPEPHVHFSRVEVGHLLASIAVLTLGFSFALGGLDGTKTSVCGLSFSCTLDGIAWDRVESILPWSAVIVVTSFFLHELAHKVSAQTRDMWAEFRASGYGLVTALLAALVTGVVLAAPGAVHIIGNATKRDSGIISIVGPLVNVALALLAAPFTLAPPANVPVIAGQSVFMIVLFVNAFLAAFNMLPIHPLDGNKVWRWSPAAYVGMIVVILGLFGVYFLGSTALQCVGQACH